MAVLSVDLAYRRWSDLGIVVLDRARPVPELLDHGQTAHPIACQIIPSVAVGQDDGPIDANILAGRLNQLCAVRGIRVMMLDGPQAWKSRTNGFEHARASERQLNTAAKTGLPGMVKPITYRAFAEFCLDVYDALCRRGWRRMDTSDRSAAPQDRVLVESYPYAAWKLLGLLPLPSKRRATVSNLAEAYGALRALIPFTTDRQIMTSYRPSSAACPGSRLMNVTPTLSASLAIHRVAKRGIGARASLCCRYLRTSPLGCAGSTDLCGAAIFSWTRSTLDRIHTTTCRSQPAASS